jgi:uncharacterized membrane protein HdeD (DUF308 family)
MTATGADTNLDAQLGAARESIRTNWAIFLTHGIVLIILGVLAVIWPQVSTLAVDIYLGWIFLFSGAFGLAVAFYAPRTSDFSWTLLSAALSLFVGVLLLWHPVEGVVSLTLILVALFIVCGASIWMRAATIKMALQRSRRGDDCRAATITQEFFS